MQLPDIVEHLEEIETATVARGDYGHKELCQIVINCFRILALTEEEIYNDILKDGLSSETVAYIADNVPEVREDLELERNLQFLRQDLRKLKLEGKVYDVLDNFFNLNLCKTL